MRFVYPGAVYHVMARGDGGKAIFIEKEDPGAAQPLPPDGKRLASTTDWPHFLAREWPRHRPAVAKEFPGHVRR